MIDLAVSHWFLYLSVNSTVPNQNSLNKTTNNFEKWPPKIQKLIVLLIKTDQINKLICKNRIKQLKIRFKN